MQIRQVLKPCVTCGESLIFGHFAPQGDVLKLNERLEPGALPACQSLGPVRTSFREACEGWNALARPDPALPEAAAAGGAPATPLPLSPWRTHAASPARPGRPFVHALNQ